MMACGEIKVSDAYGLIKHVWYYDVPLMRGRGRRPRRLQTFVWEWPPLLVAREIEDGSQWRTSTSKLGLLVIKRLAPLSQRPVRGVVAICVYE
jgi:hypothetical protein